MGTRARAVAKGARKGPAPAKKAAARKAATPRVKKEKVMHPCGCAVLASENGRGEPVYESCGGETPRSFLPGHDARLKGALIKAHRGGYELHLNGADLDPMTVASERGWEHFLKHEVKPRPKRTRGAKAGFHPVRAKVGRSVFDGVISSEVDDEHIVFAYTDAKGTAQTKTILRSAVVDDPAGAVA